MPAALAGRTADSALRSQPYGSLRSQLHSQRPLAALPGRSPSHTGLEQPCFLFSRPPERACPALVRSPTSPAKLRGAKFGRSRWRSSAGVVRCLATCRPQRSSALGQSSFTARARGVRNRAAAFRSQIELSWRHLCGSKRRLRTGTVQFGDAQTRDARRHD